MKASNRPQLRLAGGATTLAVFAFGKGATECDSRFTGTAEVATSMLSTEAHEATRGNGIPGRNAIECNASGGYPPNEPPFGGTGPGAFGPPPSSPFGPPGFPVDVNTTLPLILNILAAITCGAGCVTFVLSIGGIILAIQAGNAKNIGDCTTAKAKAKASLILFGVTVALGAVLLLLTAIGVLLGS
jgi:hypothetical protein